MNVEIQKYVAECDICQRSKTENISSPRLIHPLHIPNQKWDEISMDFIEGLPMSYEKDKILVVVLGLTKYAHFVGVKKTDSAKKQVNTFVKMSTSYVRFPKLS